MMRLIDADALYETLCHIWDVSDSEDFEKAVFKTIINAPTIDPEQQWIPCSERLPEEGQACLVSDRETILIDIYIGHGNPYNWRGYVKDYEAWMPLPEPYKADMRGEE